MKKHLKKCKIFIILLLQLCQEWDKGIDSRIFVKYTIINKYFKCLFNFELEEIKCVGV